MAVGFHDMEDGEWFESREFDLYMREVLQGEYGDAEWHVSVALYEGEDPDGRR